MIPRHTAKRDASEPEIVLALEKLGCTVRRMHKPCDLLVGYRGSNHLVEAKTPGTAYGKTLNAEQSGFNETWRGGKIIMLHSAVDAVDWVKSL